MKIVLLSVSNRKYDGRLRELEKICNAIGSTYVISLDKFIYTNKKYSYFEYRKFVKKMCNEIGKIDILLIDNRRALLFDDMVKRISKPKYVIQDCRELYEIKNMKSIGGIVGCLLESNSIKSADIVMCANEFRSYYMKEKYKLKKNPVVFENIRFFDNSFDGQDIKKDMNTLISTDERYLDKLLTVMEILGNDYKLIVAGCKNVMGEKKIQQNITLYGRLDYDELSRVILKADAGIAFYNKNDNNNLYCASGKVYEFLYYGLPIVTTDNPPLVKINQMYNVGELCDGSVNSIVNAIQRLYNNYNYYRDSVKKIKLMDIYNNNLYNTIKQIREDIF